MRRGFYPAFQSTELMSMRPLIPFLLLAYLPNLVAQVSVHRWSGDLNVPDPVACTVDEKGRVYVAATTRRKVADLDIREHTLWIPDDVALDSVEAKREFLKRELAPGKLRLPRGGLKDHNKDGSIDWKDLTVHSERIYQLRDTDGDGTADKKTIFAEGFNTEVTGIAAGILYHNGWVYATIAPDLWRLKDTDDDGVADVREVVAHGFGLHIAYAGHDMHGPRLGPDGRIYWSIGDKGVSVINKEGKKWYYPHQGCVMRVEPDGTGFEVYAHGLRNVQEIAFDDFGNMFGVDNDADMPGEKERFVYITEQSDSGWRCNHQYMKAESRWMREGVWDAANLTPPLFITPPLANYSNGPAGFVHEPGTALGPNLRGQFILNQFPSGRMEAFNIEPRGAAFQMSRARLIHSGIMGIGLGWGPEGALYMADWVGGYPLDEKGAIWRVDETDLEEKDTTVREETQALLASGFVQREVADLQKLLGHADQRVRLGAQLALAERGMWAELMAVALDVEAPLLARVHGLWGYGIGFRKGKAQVAALEELLAMDALDVELQTQTAKVLSEGKVDRTSERLLIGLLKSESPRVRFHAAIALGRLRVADAALYLLDQVEADADDPWMRHAIVTGLAGCMTAEALAARSGDASVAERLICTLALARQRSPLITAYLADANNAIVDEVARAIHDDEGIPEALPKLAALLEAERTLPEATLRRAMNANLRLGDPVHASRLLQFALKHRDDNGVTALQNLVIFTEPPRLDRVDGVARIFQPRDTEVIAAHVLQPWMSEVLTLREPDMKAAVIELLVKLSMKMEAPALREIIADTDSKAPLRVGALRLMAAQHAAEPAFAEALGIARKAVPAELRMEALRQTYAQQKDNAISETARVLEQGTLVEKQAALKLLTAAKGKEAEALVEAWLQRLSAGKVEAGLNLDVLEAVQAYPALEEKLAYFQQYRTSVPRNDLLEGGDSANGKDIVNNHLGANCLACHTVEAKEGSLVGPLLKGVGLLRTRAELLESLVNPVAKIASGYGFVSVSLKDGKSIAGALSQEDKSAITLRLADGTTKEIPREEIAMQTPPVSMMPPMLGILTPREVRDVVAYLAGLKTKPEKEQLDKIAEQTQAVAKVSPAPKTISKTTLTPTRTPVKVTSQTAAKKQIEINITEVPKAKLLEAPEMKPEGGEESPPKTTDKPSSEEQPKSKSPQKTEAATEDKPKSKTTAKPPTTTKSKSKSTPKPAPKPAPKPEEKPMPPPEPEKTEPPPPEEKPKSSKFQFRFRPKPRTE